MLSREEKNTRRRMRNATPEGKAAVRAYISSPDQKEKRAAYNHKYEAIPKHKQRRKFLFLQKRKNVWDLLGPYCRICGYNKTIAALNFHHLNPKDKSHHKDTLGIWISSKPIEYILNKIKTNPYKILCANCHAELHDCDSPDSIVS